MRLLSISATLLTVLIVLAVSAMLNAASAPLRALWGLRRA
ncbi:conserved hypothetical protein [Methylobacterium nodulans ORS 2060]|uniref:Uncharacterized protein n=1 Tax=Methylobacterium nodulans (strain LMG 21967 / CNCM I-2342 / ORS 2060) TaxID=460265 RepID=B8IC15_METNO|nr:conserved hypothetical protein [Methylobacterium nodulans ORS 2060]